MSQLDRSRLRLRTNSQAANGIACRSCRSRSHWCSPCRPEWPPRSSGAGAMRHRERSARTMRERWIAPRAIRVTPRLLIGLFLKRLRADARTYEQRRNVMKQIRLLLVPFALALAAVAMTATAQASSSERSGAVYTLTNSPNGNAVAVFDRDAHGVLTPAGTFATGGNGT